MCRTAVAKPLRIVTSKLPVGCDRADVADLSALFGIETSLVQQQAPRSPTLNVPRRAHLIVFHETDDLGFAREPLVLQRIIGRRQFALDRGDRDVARGPRRTCGGLP